MKIPVLLVLATMSTVSVASENLYFSGMVGVNSGDAVSGEGNTENYKNFGNETGWSGAVALGYKFNNAMRLELEYAHKENDSNDTRMGLTGFATDSLGTLKDDLSVDALMINAIYDFDINSRFIPFIKAGMGISKNAYSATFDVPDLEDFIGTGSFNYDKETNSEFSWNIAIGSSYLLSKQWHIFAQYQLNNIGEVSTKKDAFGDRFIDSSYTFQELSLGIRYEF